MGRRDSGLFRSTHVDARKCGGPAFGDPGEGVGFVFGYLQPYSLDRRRQGINWLQYPGIPLLKQGEQLGFRT